VGAGANYTQNFTYNAVGNILTSPVGSYSYQGHTIPGSYTNTHAATGIAGAVISYDANGNMTSDGVANTYQWDYKSRLAQATVTSTSAMTRYMYDANGARVKVIEPNGTITLYPSKYLEVSGSTSTSRVFLGDMEISSIVINGSTNARSYVHTDHLGGTGVVSDEAGNAIEVLDYYPFGQIRFDNKTGSYAEKRKYIGQFYDDSTGLLYLNARYYDGRRGQFLGEDPVHLAVGSNGRVQQLLGVSQEKLLSDPQSLNSYSYARNNPIKNKDPEGNLSWDALLSNPIGSLQDAADWGVASLGVNVINRPLTATLLRHSASLDPGEMNIDAGNQKRYGSVINSIKGTSQYRNFVNQSIENAKNGRTITSGSLQFDKGDLYTSLHRVNIEVNVQNPTNPQTYKGTVTRVPATQAYKDQQKGILSNYNINIKFKDKIKK
jgi:RHS repeat-associated protein